MDEEEDYRLKERQLKDLIYRLINVAIPIHDCISQDTPQVVGIATRMEEREQILQHPLIQEILEERKK